MSARGSGRHWSVLPAVAIVVLGAASALAAYGVTRGANISAMLHLRANAHRLAHSSSQPGAPRRSGAVRPVSRTAAPQATTVTLYFPDEQGQLLLAEKRPVGPGQATPLRAIQELLAGPKAEGEAAAFPAGVAVLGVSAAGGVATVDLSSTALAGGGGSTQETMAVYAIVQTLAQFTGISSVRFEVEHKPIDTLYGQMDLSAPVGADPALVGRRN